MLGVPEMSSGLIIIVANCLYLTRQSTHKGITRGTRSCFSLLRKRLGHDLSVYVEIGAVPRSHDGSGKMQNTSSFIDDDVLLDLP